MWLVSSVYLSVSSRHFKLFQYACHISTKTSWWLLIELMTKIGHRAKFLTLMLRFDKGLPLKTAFLWLALKNLWQTLP